MNSSLALYAEEGQMKKAFVGIDPGVSGAVALLWNKGAFIHDFVDYRTATITIRAWLVQFNVVVITIEDLTSRPGKGHFGSFKLAKNLGFWIGYTHGIGMTPVMVRPQEWQKRVIGPRPSTEKDSKERSLGSARQHFPFMYDHLKFKKHHNRADALNICYYGYLMDKAEQRRIQ